jgi:AcrR family transcriptional regulator
MRADAQRSYDRILAVAGDVFVEQGTNASMNEIAKRAGVGAGTLYRHFPDREHLLDVLLKDWVAQIQAAADQTLVAGLPPRELLITWFEAVVRHISVHRGGAARLTAALGNTASMVDKWQGLATANQSVVRHLEARGAIRGGADTIQICRLVGGVAAVADAGGLLPDDTRDLLALIADGLLVAPPAALRYP